ncbi:MAG: pyruvate formate lyase family protein, partial [Promethearchaeota archaeon]
MVVQNLKMAPLQGTPSERVRKIRDKMLSQPFEYDLERARCYSRIWKQMEDAHPYMKKAKALEEFLRCLPIRIGSDEILVGVKSSKIRADPFEIELGRHVRTYDFLLDDSIDETAKDYFRRRNPILRRYVPFTEEELDELKNDIIPVWKGKTLADRKEQLWIKAGLFKEKKSFMERAMSWINPLYAEMQGHTIPGYKRVLKIGFKGIEKRAIEELEKLKEDDEDFDNRKTFYEAVQVCAKAVCDYSNRYADLAMKMAENASETRKAELLEIAERARRVPALPPRTFIEALQSIWLTNVVMEMSYGEGNIFSQGRVDQYLY